MIRRQFVVLSLSSLEGFPPPGQSVCLSVSPSLRRSELNKQMRCGGESVETKPNSVGARDSSATPCVYFAERGCKHSG